jgi:xanthine dehydrogenase accessory factor
VTLWIAELRRRLGARQSVVRVVVKQARGSTPREAGVVMLVDEHSVHGTIGGGELEWRAQKFARDMLVDEACRVRTERWPLGPELGQCCGGSVTLWFERVTVADAGFFSELNERLARGERGWLLSRVEQGRVVRHWLIEPVPAFESDTLCECFDRSDPPVWVFGAGHVGRALAHTMEPLPFALTVVDSRDEWLAGVPGLRVQRVCEADPVSLVAAIPPGSVVLVMTHSHELDYAICRAALERHDLDWVGLIGSETKATCFRLRLGRDGVHDDHIAALVSPIGIGGVRSKLPAAIAVSVAAQLLQRASLDQKAQIDPDLDCRVDSQRALSKKRETLS